MQLMYHRSFSKLPYSVLLAIFLYFNCTPLFAQYPSDYKEEIRKSQQQQKTTLKVDTLSPDVYYFFLDNPAQTTLWEEKDLNNFHIFAPTRQAEYDYNDLGNLGSAAKSIVYQPSFRKGFDTGFNSFDIYKITKEAIRYYKLEKVYSDVTFSQGTTQEQTNFAGKFSKNLSKKINFAIDYKRINNRGQYANQRNRNTSFSMNSWYHSPSNHYQAYASYTTNTVQQLENGGVNTFDDTGALNTRILSLARPVNTSNAEARYFQRELNFTHYFILGKKPTTAASKRRANKKAAPSPPNDTLTIIDTSKAQIKTPPLATKKPLTIPTKAQQRRSFKGRQYTLFHQFLLKRNTYKFSDNARRITTDFYKNFFLDERGVRHFTDIRSYENTFSIRTFRLQKNTTRFAQLDKKGTSTRDLFEVGLTHAFTDIARRTADSTAHNLFLFGTIQYTPSDRLKVHAYAHLGLAGQGGDYYAKGDFLLDFPKVGKVELGLITQQYAPNLLQQQLLITQQPIWATNFSKTFENSLFASYYIPLLRLKIKGQFHVLSNYIFFNENAFPEQTNDEITVTQLLLDHQLNWKGFQLENTIYYQKTAQQYLRLPEWYSIHRLSYTNTLFKKTLTYQIGTQLRIHTPYFMDGFQPLIAQFHVQNQQQNTSYPNIDAFINIRIADFRFFINAQNIADYFRTDFYYPFYQYPLFDTSIRFGFRWVFLD